MATVSASVLFTHVAPEALAGKCVVIVDLLRAGTTITRALAAGARDVRLFMEPEEAVTARDALGAPCLLGGERGGVLIPGFDLDNSPQAYTPERVRERHVLFTTTNGSRAALYSSQAAKVVFGCFNNLTALAQYIAEARLDTHILCAGTHLEISAEDCIFGGALIERLAQNGLSLASDDGALLLRDLWVGLRRGDLVRPAVHASKGGRNLQRLGLQADIDECLRVDVSRIVPCVDPATGIVTPD